MGTGLGPRARAVSWGATYRVFGVASKGVRVHGVTVRRPHAPRGSVDDYFRALLLLQYPCTRQGSVTVSCVRLRPPRRCPVDSRRGRHRRTRHRRNNPLAARKAASASPSGHRNSPARRSSRATCHTASG